MHFVFRLTLLALLPVAALAQAPTRTTLAVRDGALAAQVQTPLGEQVASGSVDFLLPSGQSLGSAVVRQDGTATLPLSTLPPATAHAIDGSANLPVTAVYSPSDAYSGSASVAAPVPAVTTTAPDFALTGSPTTVSVAAGAYGSTAVTITSVGGYSGAIQFSCANLPPLATCVFNPTQQTLAANGTFTTTLQMQTAARSGTASSALEPLLPASLTLALTVPGALFLFGLGRRRRWTHLLGVSLLLAAATVTLPGCSQRYSYLKHPPPIAPGTPAGTYGVTIFADGNQGAAVLEHSLSVSLVVQ